MENNTLNFSQSIKQEDLVGVVMKCPYANWKNPLTQSLFTKIVDLKISAYQRKYFFGIMPLDVGDYVTDHLAIFHKKSDGELVPLLVVKTLPFDLCRPFQINFTIEDFFTKNQMSEHVGVLHSMIDNCYKKNGRISYYSSWTISPAIIHDREFVGTLKEMFAAMTMLYHQEIGVTELLGLGVPRFRTDAFFHSWGFDPVMNQGKELAKVPLQFTEEIPGVFMHLKKYSDYAIAMSEKYQDFWAKHISVGENAAFGQEMAVAA